MIILIGQLLFILKNMRRLLNTEKKSLAISEVQGDSIGMLTTLNNLGAINTVNQNFEKATAYYFKGLNLVKDKKDYVASDHKQRFLANISGLYNRQEKV